MSKRFYVYFLFGRKSRYYIGVSNNVKKRLYEHNSGISKYTAPYRPFILKRVEGFDSIKDAYSRERFIKSKKSQKIIRSIVESSPDVLAEQEIGIPIQRS